MSAPDRDWFEFFGLLRPLGLSLRSGWCRFYSLFSTVKTIKFVVSKFSFIRFFLVMALLLIFTGRPSSAENIGLSVRALGMGNSYSSVVKDGDSVFYNPAGLARMTGLRWTVIDPAIGVNSLTNIEEAVGLARSSNPQAALEPFFGEPVSLYVGGSKSLLGVGGFVAGAYGVSDLNLSLSNPAFPQLGAEFIADYGFLVGWGGTLIPKRLDLGVVARRITRRGGQANVGPGTLFSATSGGLADSFNNVGVGTAIDLGLNLSLPWATNPTLAFVARNIGDTQFSAIQGSGAPPISRQEYLLSAGLLIDGAVADFSLSLDYRHLFKDMALGKKISTGFEVSLPVVSLRAGFHQGYLSAGLGCNFWLMRLDFATYAEERGAYPGQRPDRRYLLQLGLHLILGGSRSKEKARGRRREPVTGGSSSEVGREGSPSRSSSDSPSPIPPSFQRRF